MTTRIAGRNWSEKQRNFGYRGNLFTETEEPIEVYKEDGVLVKRYAARAAGGVGYFCDVRTKGEGL